MAPKNKTEKDNSGSNWLSLICEVIEVFEKDDRSVAKIRFNPGYLELEFDPDKDYHLGDELVIEGNFNIKHILQNITDAL